MMSYLKENKKRKQTLKSVQYELEIIFKSITTEGLDNMVEFTKGMDFLRNFIF